MVLVVHTAIKAPDAVALGTYERICQSIDPRAVREVRDAHTAGMHEQPQDAGESHQS
jgi:phage FluMu gp28-like protein